MHLHPHHFSPTPTRVLLIFFFSHFFSHRHSLSPSSFFSHPKTSCSSSSLVYDKSTDRCIPAFVHTGCPATLPVSVAVYSCANKAFDAFCNATCPTGYTGNRTSYWCNQYAVWVPYKAPAMNCVGECVLRIKYRRGAGAVYAYIMEKAKTRWAIVSLI